MLEGSIKSANESEQCINSVYSTQQKTCLLFSAGSLCQKKFKNLKDTFAKIINQIRTSMKSGAGAADVATVKWKHFLPMQAIMEPVSEEPM